MQCGRRPLDIASPSSETAIFSDDVVTQRQSSCYASLYTSCSSHFPIRVFISPCRNIEAMSRILDVYEFKPTPA